uniref:Uncharacterized protein n=1 Tax=Toxoplasma gondii TgCATBr9 TaxID=943120 RepID=A0A2T6IS26_TOXGO|nr:hypothetical protein TGBR9_382520 [Toxoplasma gondii TgCATBr9]
MDDTVKRSSPEQTREAEQRRAEQNRGEDSAWKDAREKQREGDGDKGKRQRDGGEEEGQRDSPKKYEPTVPENEKLVGDLSESHE